jgi:hypothetical protein
MSVLTMRCRASCILPSNAEDVMTRLDMSITTLNNVGRLQPYRKCVYKRSAIVSNEFMLSKYLFAGYTLHGLVM